MSLVGFHGCSPVSDNCHRMSWILRDRLTSRFVSERCRRLDRHLAGRRCRALGPTGATPALFLLSNEAPELARNRNPLPYRTPYRTRRVPVAQDLMWEKFPIQDPVFCGLGERPAEFPEIELTYDTKTARAEAARCYRCDAETGSADYSVQHREDIFSMARTDPQDAPKLKAMLDRRLRLRENPFPEERPACLDDLVFLPANLSRLVIDPYREACKIGWRLGERLDLDIPFFVAGFDAASEWIFRYLPTMSPFGPTRMAVLKRRRTPSSSQSSA